MGQGFKLTTPQQEAGTCAHLKIEWRTDTVHYPTVQRTTGDTYTTEIHQNGRWECLTCKRKFVHEQFLTQRERETAEACAVIAKEESGQHGFDIVCRRGHSNRFCEHEIARRVRQAFGVGNAVAVRGELAVVGAPWTRVGGPVGSSIIFRRDTSGWFEEATLYAPQPEDLDFFGYAVGLGDGTVLVGAPYADPHGPASGMVASFECDTGS